MSYLQKEDFWTKSANLSISSNMSMNQTRLTVIHFKNQMKKNQKSLIGTRFSDVSATWMSYNEAYEEVVYWHKNVFMVLVRTTD